MTFSAIILAGGRSARMGADKATLQWNCERTVERVWHLAREAGASEVVVAGGDYGLPFVSDAVTHGGPVGGVLAGVAALGSAERFLILAVDAPTLLVEDLRQLLAAGPPGAAFRGQPLPMVVWRDAVSYSLRSDSPLRQFVERAGLQNITQPRDASARLRGANTPAEWRALREEIAMDTE